MKNKENVFAVGIDIGTSRVVTAHRLPDEERFATQLNAFVAVPYSKMTQASLELEKVPFTRSNGSLMVYGNDSGRLADLLGQEIRRPMAGGVLNAQEPEAVAQIGEILRSLLSEVVGQAPRICFSVPAAPLGSTASITYHEASIKQVLNVLGFTDVRAVQEGLAVIYSELERSSYSGLGISFGGGLCNVTLASLAVPLLSFSVPKGGDYIDSNVAAVTGDLINRVRLIKEQQFHFNGIYADKTKQALTIYYDDMIRSVVRGLEQSVDAAHHLPKFGRPVPVALSGGGVLPDGFAARFENALRSAALPFEIGEVRLAASPLQATARGAMLAALTE